MDSNQSDSSYDELDDESILTLAYSMVLLAGMKNRTICHLHVYESEVGKLPRNKSEYTEFAKKLMRLQGYNPDVFFGNKDTDILTEIHDLPNDRVFIVVIATKRVL